MMFTIVLQLTYLPSPFVIYSNQLDHRFQCRRFSLGQGLSGGGVRLHIPTLGPLLSERQL